MHCHISALAYTTVASNCYAGTMFTSLFCRGAYFGQPPQAAVSSARGLVQVLEVQRFSDHPVLLRVRRVDRVLGAPEDLQVTGNLAWFTSVVAPCLAFMPVRRARDTGTYVVIKHGGQYLLT